MGGYLQSVIDSGKSIDSARALYDNWVGCCEAVYAEEVATPEYAQIHGHLVNAQMALKKRMAIMVDENLGAMNMPSRSELRTLQDRLQETRRENKQLRHRSACAGATGRGPRWRNPDQPRDRPQGRRASRQGPGASQAAAKPGATD